MGISNITDLNLRLYLNTSSTGIYGETNEGTYPKIINGDFMADFEKMFGFRPDEVNKLREHKTAVDRLREAQGDISQSLISQQHSILENLKKAGTSEFGLGGQNAQQALEDFKRASASTLGLSSVKAVADIREHLAKQAAGMTQLTDIISLRDQSVKAVLRMAEFHVGLVSRLDEVRGFMDTILSAKTIRDQMELYASGGFWTDYQNTLGQRAEEARKALHGIASSRLIDTYLSETDRIRKMVGGISVKNTLLQSSLLGAGVSYQGNISRLLETVVYKNNLQGNKAFVDTILRPSIEVGQFLNRTLHRMETEDNPIYRAAYGRAIVFTEEQLNEGTELIETITVNDLPGIEEYEEPEYQPKFNLWTVQRRELRRNPLPFEEHPDIDASEATIAGKIAAAARSSILKWAEISKRAEFKGMEIFRPTARIVEITQILTGVCPESVDDFGSVLDALYFMFYEGAGAAHLKFQKDYGLASIDEADAIMCIKFFRNHWRHDPEHGSKGDIRKKYNTVAEYLGKLGFQDLPSTSTEFAELHYRLLAYLNNFLDLLYARVLEKEMGN